MMVRVEPKCKISNGFQRWNRAGTNSQVKRKILPPAAIRALEEAEARRQDNEDAPRAKELKGRTGPEPTRYGDWETNGIVSDF